MFDHRQVEAKWQDYWEKNGINKTGEDPAKPKFYILDMFPYPSGAGLHVGHPKGYIATDIFARYKTMKGFNVLHPMGWDAFGLPAENFAIKNKVHPKICTQQNIDTYKRQLHILGFNHDWSREISTIDPSFYKWTQWAFLKMFEKGLAYESYEPINWCPSCKTGLANEDLEGDRCERCDTLIEKKPMRQWVLRITDYAERMLNDLDKLPHWEESIKEMQRNWIGKSEGSEVKFEVKSLESNTKSELTVFTTRPDTLFGCTYMVVAPEHPLIKNFEPEIINYAEINGYIEKAKNKSDLDRTDLNKDKTGVRIEGLMAVNPVNSEEIPIYVADYVMMGYGTGAIMAVPAHDERDWEFAKKYNIKIVPVVMPENQEIISSSPVDKQKKIDIAIAMVSKSIIEQGAGVGDGINFNSDFLNGLTTNEAKEKMINWLEEKKIGKRAVNYKIKDWVFSRQRYWGEPIPLVHCEKCGVVGLPEDQLPLTLPEVESYEPTGTGESPLAAITDWVNTTCPQCGGPAKRETNTMPQWAGSSWYYLRYIDPQNDEALADKDKDKYWSPVDFYVGGAEHATRHLIYARFWHKFLFDIGAVNYDEPFTRLQHVGLIMAEDGRKMSKRWGNVINPDDIVAKHGADAMRVYEMFMGPFSQSCAWSTNGLVGARKFLERIYKFRERAVKQAVENKKLESLLHKTIKKVGDDIENFKLNTAVSAMMILANEMEKEKEIFWDHYSQFIILLSPFAPHLAEEIWSGLGNAESIFKQAWPEYDPALAKDEMINLVLQINGKVRDMVEVSADIAEDEAKKVALESEKINKWLNGTESKKVVYVKGKLVNIVI